MGVLVGAVAAVASLALGTNSAATKQELAASCPGEARVSAPAGVQLATMRCVVNQVRRKHGLSPLRNVGQLDRASLLRAQRIRSCGDFSHTPCGEPFLRVFAQVGYLRGRRWAVGENLSWSQGRLASPRSTVAGWLSSPEHRQILLSANWRDLGISLVRANRLFGRSNVTVWVAQFGRHG